MGASQEGGDDVGRIKMPGEQGMVHARQLFDHLAGRTNPPFNGPKERKIVG